MKKTLLFIILCLIMSSCMQKEVIPSSHTQNNSQNNIAEFNEASAKQVLADYLNIQDADALKIIKQYPSSFVIQMTDIKLITDQPKDLERFYYSVYDDGKIVKHTVPEKLIGTWSNEDHTRTYIINEQTISISDNELGISNETYHITGFDHAWIENKFKSRDHINGVQIIYCMNWLFDDFYNQNPQKSDSILYDQFSTFYYNPQTETFQIKDKDMIFTKKDNVKEELLYEYKVPDILIGTWSDKDHSNSFTINDQTITVYDYDAGIDNITYDITGFDCLPLDSKGKLVDYKGKILLYRLFWDIGAFRERYPDTDLSTSFFVFYYDLETNTFKLKDTVFTKQGSIIE